MTLGIFAMIICIAYGFTGYCLGLHDGLTRDDD